MFNSSKYVCGLIHIVAVENRLKCVSNQVNYSEHFFCRAHCVPSLLSGGLYLLTRSYFEMKIYVAASTEAEKVNHILTLHKNKIYQLNILPREREEKVKGSSS